MRPSLAFALALALALVGCAAKADDPASDPFAYTRKPLYTGGFALDQLGGQTRSQEFRVTDGSIGAIRVQVWVNATAGGATVEVVDPSGDLTLLTQETTDTTVGLDLGAWTVRVTPDPGSAGAVAILVTRG